MAQEGFTHWDILSLILILRHPYADGVIYYAYRVMDISLYASLAMNTGNVHHSGYYIWRDKTRNKVLHLTGAGVLPSHSNLGLNGKDPIWGRGRGLRRDFAGILAIGMGRGLWRRCY